MQKKDDILVTEGTYPKVVKPDFENLKRIDMKHHEKI